MRRSDLGPGFIAASRRALAEVAELLEEDPLAVVVGGMVPFLRLDQTSEPHEGTVDIDVVLDLNARRVDAMTTLHDELMRRDFQQDTRQPFRWTKTIAVEGEDHEILLEFLAGGVPTGDGLALHQSEDLYASVIDGMQVALQETTTVSFGDHDSLRVASWPGYLAMKTAALAGRSEEKKPKDAYDIVYCLRRAPQEIAQAVRAALPGSPLVRARLLDLAELFSGPESLGPRMYATRGEDREHAEVLAMEATTRVEKLMDEIEDLLC